MQCSRIGWILASYDSPLFIDPRKVANEGAYGLLLLTYQLRRVNLQLVTPVVNER
jgi:hypothetical protein